MDTLDVFATLGLNEKESAIYCAALELGSTTAAIIAKKASVQRTHFYDLVEKLLSKGFLHKSIQGSKTVYSATNPEEILKLQEEKIETLKRNLPELKALYNTLGNKPRVLFFEGTEGIGQINEDTLRYKGELVGFTTPLFMNSKTRNAGKSFIQKRVAIGKRSRVIGENNPEIRDLQKRDATELRETRILSHSVFNSSVEIVMYENRIAVVDYHHLWGIIIESPEITHVMKMVFEIIWLKWEH